MAERQGFEPWRRFPAYTLSRRAPSTTRPPLRGAFFNAGLTGNSSAFCLFDSIIDMQIDAPVLAALFFDLTKMQTTNFSCPGHVGATAGLQINLRVPLPDPYEPHLARPTRRRD